MASYEHLFKKQPSDYRKAVSHRFAGYRPPKALMKRLRRLYPQMDLMWCADRGLWVLVQTDQAQVHIVTILQDREGKFVAPTVENTIGLLDRCNPANLDNQWAIDRWIEENLSEEISDPEAEARIEENIHEFSDRLWHLKEEAPVSVVPDPRRT
jgi:hypothetical protein